jgi:hypothetical protein
LACHCQPRQRQAALPQPRRLANAYQNRRFFPLDAKHCRGCGCELNQIEDAASNLFSLGRCVRCSAYKYNNPDALLMLKSIEEDELRAEREVLNMRSEKYTFAIELGKPMLPISQQFALERLQRREWLRLIDLSPVAAYPNKLFRVFLVTEQAREWLRKTAN